MRKVIDKTIQLLCTFIMGIMVVAVCWQVITRFVLNSPSTVTEEALRYLLIWTTMIGAAYAYGRRKHLSINIIIKKLSPSNQIWLDIGVQILVIAFCCIVMIMGGNQLSMTASDQISPALGIPMPFIYSSVIVGGILFIFYALIFVGEDIQKLKQLKS